MVITYVQEYRIVVSQETSQAHIKQNFFPSHIAHKLFSSFNWICRIYAATAVNHINNIMEASLYCVVLLCFLTSQVLAEPVNQEVCVISS